MGKLCQCTHSFDAIEGHDEALQFPQVLDCQSKAGLEDLDVFHIVFVDFSSERMLISEEVLHVILDGASDISIGKNLNKILHLNALVEIAGSS